MFRALLLVAALLAHVQTAGAVEVGKCPEWWDDPSDLVTLSDGSVIVADTRPGPYRNDNECMFFSPEEAKRLDPGNWYWQNFEGTLPRRESRR